MERRSRGKILSALLILKIRKGFFFVRIGIRAMLLIDPDEANHNTPIDGANDGASGVGALLEIARVLSSNTPPIGVDIILFDLEDYGPPQGAQSRDGGDYWGLGSQYWSKNPHVYNYKAKYGILLDMVGDTDARFLMEGFSLYYAPHIVKKVWENAEKMGYGDYFVKEKGGYITDDHYYINEIAGIPTIDIIHLVPDSRNGSFVDYWHTIGDTLGNIDPQTLKVVGEVVLQTVFEEGISPETTTKNVFCEYRALCF